MRSHLKPLKVTHLLTSLNNGGITTFVFHLIQELNKYSVKSSIIVTMEKGHLSHQFEQLGVQIHTCSYRFSFKDFLSYKISKILRNSARFTFIPRLYYAILKSDPHYVHSHLHSSNWLGQALIARLTKIPFLLHLHSPSSPEINKRINWFLPWFTTDTFSFNTPSRGIRSAYNRLLNRLATPPRSIKYGIPIHQPNVQKVSQLIKDLFIEENYCTIGYIGRIIDHKRIGDLLTAVKILNEQNISVALIIIGDGGQREKYEKLSNFLGLKNIVRFVGFQTDVENWLSIVDILVLPSLFEGFPICILEAMAYGVPTVGTDVPGTQEAIHHDKTGILVPLMDPESLAKALQNLIANPEKRKLLATNGKLFFKEHFEISKCAEKYYQLYSHYSEN